MMPPPEDEIRSMTAYGSPAQVIEELTPAVRALAAYPESHLIVRLYYPGMTAAPAAEAIRLFAEAVAPELRRVASGS